MKIWYDKFVLIFLMAICVLVGTNSIVAERAVASNQNINAWVAYWDMKSGIDEVEKANKKENQISETYGSISYFAAYFDSKGKLFIPDELKVEDKLNIQDKYLSIVNDVQGEKKNLFKDTDIVKKVLADDKKQAKHADEIIKLVKKSGCNGIDLDYEKVFREEETAKLYLKFIKLLYAKAQENNLKMRVILEPNVHFDEFRFPVGPEYVVMLYNLYGLHSDEGPKADFKFIRSSIDKMKVLPRPIGVAFATGGCYWNSNGEKKFISAKQAAELARKYKKTPERSLKSNALRFTYTDDKDVEYTVWYADRQTISSWINKAKDAGIDNVSVWRMGSNEAIYDFGND